MTDFFTPVQVIDQNQKHSDCYEIDKYKNDPFMPTSARIQSIGDHRKKIIQWLKNMPISARISKLTYTNKQFACLLMSMFQRSQDRNRDCLRQFGILFTPQRGFKIVQQRFISKPNIELLNAQHKLLDSITIMNRYSRFDSVTINRQLASDINSLFQLFDVIENGVSHQLMPHNYQNYLQQNNNNTQIMFYNPVDHDCCITKTLGLWFVEAVKKNLCMQYFKELRQNKICQSVKPNQQNDKKKIIQVKHKQNCHQQKQQIKQKLKSFKKYWNNLQINSRQQFLFKILTRDIRPILNQYRHTIKISCQNFPRVKYCNEQIDIFMENLIGLDGQYLLNQLMFTKLEDCLFDFAIYKYEIMIQVQLEIQKKKKQDVLNMKKKINKLILKNNKKIDNKEVQNTQSNKQKQFILSLIPKQSVQQQPKINQQIKKSKKKVKTNQKTKKLKKKQNSFQGAKQISQTTNDQDQDQKDMLTDQNFNTPLIQQPTNKKLAQQQFNKILMQFQQRRNKWTKYQQIAINRISSILQIYNLSYQLFGSVANGLAIPQSDIDICVDPTIVHYFYTSFCSYREKVIMSLKFLQSCFEQLNWVTNFNLITTANVPLLVFEIDLSIPYGDIKDMQYNPSKLQKAPKICVDLTIQSFTNMNKQFVPHLGYQSTSLVQEWLTQNQNLGALTRVVKHILNKYNLNKSFTGGISSYALTSIIYSFLKQNTNSLNKKQSIFELIIEFLKFITKFNQNNTIIKVCNQKPFQNQNVDRLTVQNYLNGKNLTQNCYKFNQIKQLLLKVFENLTEYQKCYCQKQYAKKLRSLLLQ